MNRKKLYPRTIDDYWSFRTSDTKEYTHCYHTYPAMMIPHVARKLLTDYVPEGMCKLVFDPYVGSGTTLVEASLLGFQSIGTDLNPLARLMSRVKTTHFNLQEIDKAFGQIVSGLMKYHPSDVKDTDFSRISNYSYWYSEDSLYRLSYLSQIIAEIPTKVQDFFRLCLSETVREVSFTRNGEFKRYRMSAKQLERFSPDVFVLFKQKA